MTIRAPRGRWAAGGVLLLLLCAPGCAKRAPAASPASPPVGAHEDLDAVLWIQTAVEYRALARQTYRLAAGQLDAALADPTWTAALEQEGDPSALPPAVIVDVDETVLSNSAHTVRDIFDGTEFNEQSWGTWVEEARAPAVPGAVEFAQQARSKGVTIFYVTNRRAVLEEATRRNLAALGFPVDATRDTVLSVGERPEWASSDKTARRRFVAAEFRVLLLVGDDFGDFVPARSSLEERAALDGQYQARWGRQWIVLPNPVYGSWEGATFGFEYGRSHAEKLRLKRERLDQRR
jgi:5'-nucleotidase (lipoprotein e(P4) family)